MLNAKKKKALAALLSERTRLKAAEKAGISESTLRLYLRDTEFLTAYNSAVSELLSDTVNQVKRSLSPAISTLEDISEDKAEATNNRIAASRGLLEFGLKLIETFDLLSRIEKLEAKQGGADGD